MSPPTKQASRHVEAVLAALDLLDCFQRKPNLAIKDLITMTGQTRNRVMRLAGTLTYRGYLVFNPEQGLYGLGPRLLVLGKVFESSQSLVTLARPILRRMVDETGESVSLYVREDLERVVIAREEGTQNLRFSVGEGQRMELYAGAGGKVLLAWAPKAILQRVLKKKHLRRLTENTITDPRALAEELETVRAQGYAISQAERDQEAIALAAPVFDDRGELAAALAIVGPEKRMARFAETGGTAFITAAGAELSGLLGWSGATTDGTFHSGTAKRNRP